MMRRCFFSFSRADGGLWMMGFVLLCSSSRVCTTAAFSPASLIQPQQSHFHHHLHYSSKPIRTDELMMLDETVRTVMGWERYSMVPLPDSMMSTTVFVGNLCEFVDNNDLSELFRSVSGLSSLPSVVVRKPDTSSMRYGFVSFPTVQEKEVSTRAPNKDVFHIHFASHIS
jgi:hypothetical protein